MNSEFIVIEMFILASVPPFSILNTIVTNVMDEKNRKLCANVTLCLGWLDGIQSFLIVAIHFIKLLINHFATSDERRQWNSVFATIWFNVKSIISRSEAKDSCAAIRLVTSDSAVDRICLRSTSDSPASHRNYSIYIFLRPRAIHSRW